MKRYLLVISILFLVLACEKHSKSEKIIIDLVVNQLKDPESFRFDKFVVEDISKRHVMEYEAFANMAHDTEESIKKGREIYNLLNSDSTDIKKYRETITIHYGAKNGYGGMVRGVRKFLLKNDGTIDREILIDYEFLY